MLARILAKSFKFRASRISVAILAVVVAAAIMGSMISLESDIERKFSQELRSYGANLLIIPKGNLSAPVGIGGLELATASIVSDNPEYIDANVLRQMEKLRHSGDISTYAPYLYGVVKSEGQPLVLAGVEFDQLRQLTSGWKITGRWVDATSGRHDKSGKMPCMVGVAAAKSLGWRSGSTSALYYEGKTQPIQVSGVVQTGSSEDHQILANISEVAEIFGLSEVASLVMARSSGDLRHVEATTRRIQTLIPSVETKLLRQITESDKNILNRIRKLTFLTSAIILISSALCLMTTMLDLVIQRKQEIGLMKAIGAEDKKIAQIFLSEAAILGFIGGSVGYVFGFLLSQLIGKSVFNTSISTPFFLFPTVVVISTLIALISGILPAKRAMEVDPIIALKEE